MSLYKRGGVYHYDITLDGKRLRGSTKQKDEYLAKLFLNDRIAEARKRGVDSIIRKPPTFREFSEEFRQWVENSQNLEPKTKTYYLHGLGMLLTAKLADMRVDYIKNHDCETLQFKGGNYNANCALRTLRRLFSKAKELGKLPEVPNIKLRKELPRTIAMSMPDATLIASHMTGDPRDALLVMRGTGCRPEECFRMRWEYARIDKGYYQNPNGKTKSSRRAIPLLWDSVEVLARRHAEQGSPREGWVFPAKSKTGHMVTILKAFTKARNAAGLPKAMVLYTSRHGQLTDMGEVLPLAELMKLGGHVDARTAMRYQHPNVKDLQARLEAAKTTGRIQ